MIRGAFRIAAACLLGAGLAHAASAAGKIGVTAAVQNEVQGIAAGDARALAAGSQVFEDETIRTGAKSMAQLLFLDETTLSVGPQSEVKLDKFVYSPSSGRGDVVLSATKGAFRFITGSQNPTNYRLNTAIATIGVRGTIVDCYLTGLGLYCIAQEGTVIIVVDGIEHVLHPGEALFVSADGTVDGPMTPDGEFFRVAGIVPFGLYGGLLPGEHEHTEVPDGATVRADDLFPQEPPCGYYCNY